MEVFFGLVLKLIPLYVIIFLGFLAAKKFKADKETVANILIYLIVPFVFFLGGYQSDLSMGTLLMPVVVYSICTIVALIFNQIGKFSFKDSTRNLLPLASALGNTGYFGIPVALILFGEEAFALATIATLGDAIFSYSLGYYFVSRGRYTVKDSVKRVVRMPAIYAFALGLLIGELGIILEDSVLSTVSLFKGAYSVLGLMIVGLGLGATKLQHVDKKFMGLSFAGRFLAWPILVLSLLYLDGQFFEVFNEQMKQVLILFSMCPLAANTVAFATELKIHPEKAAITVFSSTIFALFYIPMMATLFLY